MFKLLFVFLLVGAVAYAEINKITDVVVKDLDGKDVSFSKYSGKCVLVINTASGCGFTAPNMKWLNDITERYKNLAVVAFPSNSFNQEPKTNEQLSDYFFNQWKVKYDVYAPVSVTDSEVYKFLIKKAGKVNWNYGKYVIEKDGKTVEKYSQEAGSIVNFPKDLNKHLSECSGD